MCVSYKCQTFKDLNIGKCPSADNKECGGRGVSTSYHTDRNRLKVSEVYSTQRTVGDSLLLQCCQAIAYCERSKYRTQIIRSPARLRQLTFTFSQRIRGNVGEVQAESVLVKPTFVLEERFKLSSIPVLFSESRLSYDITRTLRPSWFLQYKAKERRW